MSRQRWLKWLTIFGCWTLVSLVYASHLYFFHTLRGEAIAWREVLVQAFADFYAWAALTPVILYLAANYTFNSPSWVRSLLVHLPASLCFSLVQVVLHTLLDCLFLYRLSSLSHFPIVFLSLAARTFHFGLLVYWSIVFISQAADYYKNRELKAAHLETQLVQAQLQALKMQLHPHFLFNTLHTISALVRTDAETANTMIARLSELLRVSLATHDQQEATLKQELETLNLYLEIEALRFRDRLTVRMSIDPAVLDARVPNFILQPLVENAIRHGINKRRGAGVIELHAARQRNALLLRILDDGPGLKDSGSGGVKEGIGLGNARARLEQLYGSRYRLDLRNLPERGTELLLEVPYHEMD